jgi:excinuclease UvrABC ATPase subunit
MKNEIIEIIHANENNLKNVSLKIPKNEITVVTGVSGSGKSSLVFDTLAAESQRMLNETYSSYVQQILPHYSRPDVEKISNLPVSIVINQKKLGGNARSTVGTVTDIYTLLRLLFSRIGVPFAGYSMVYSFNNKQGMCPYCQGLGVKKEINLHKLINFDKSLNEGAIQFPTFQPGGWRLSRYTESGYFDQNKAVADYSEEDLDLLLYGKERTPDHPTQYWHKTAKYIGIIPRLNKSFLEKEQNQYKEEIENIVNEQVCSYCNGQRLNEKSLSSKINGKSIGDCSEISVGELILFIESIKDLKVQGIVEDIIDRLRSIEYIGLDYINLNRVTSTLSGGESQRIKMAKHLNSSLSDIMYIFDEPSTGLHPNDIEGVNKIFQGLRDKGNTVIIVDHDPDIIKIADHVIDMGPKSGICGGELLFEGSYEQLLLSDTLTGKALVSKHRLKLKKKTFSDFYILNNVSKFNLRNVSVKIPIQALTVVTGVAGSGKSTLISKEFKEAYPDSILLDQRAIYGSTRSTIVTYLGIFDEIKKVFEKESGKSASLFSFNGKGGCSLCKGRGFIKTDLAFMGDVEEVCELCNGKRYSKEALSYKYKGYNIGEILELTVNETLSVFEEEKITIGLKALVEANLGYIKLGQSLNTFSGGEIQRLKLANILLELKGKILILDEPTTGLHESDIESLIDLLQRIIDRGVTVIALEHNLSVMCEADWIIDLGPKGGSKGGQIMFMGHLEDFVHCENSFTKDRLVQYVESKSIIV